MESVVFVWDGPSGETEVTLLGETGWIGIGGGEKEFPPQKVSLWRAGGSEVSSLGVNSSSYLVAILSWPSPP